MGADLCGFMLFGPKRLRKEAIRAAKEAARPLMEAVSHELKKDEPFGKDEIDEVLRGLDPAELADSFGVVPDAAKRIDGSKLIGLFVDMWHNRVYRDVAMRTDPRDTSRQVLFAGQPTWGDGPEPESGWWVCQAMATLGLLTTLGVQ